MSVAKACSLMADGIPVIYFSDAGVFSGTFECSTIVELVVAFSFFKFSIYLL